MVGHAKRPLTRALCRAEPVAAEGHRRRGPSGPPLRNPPDQPSRSPGQRPGIGAAGPPALARDGGVFHGNGALDPQPHTTGPRSSSRMYMIAHTRETFR